VGLPNLQLKQVVHQFARLEMIIEQRVCRPSQRDHFSTRSLVSMVFHSLLRLARQPTLLRFIHDVGELPVPLHLQDDRIAWSESRKRFAQLCRRSHPCAVDGVNDITPGEG
jgi:hypothetical protein